MEFLDKSSNPIVDAFIGAGKTFHYILHDNEFVPSHNCNGFTERNLTFNLCKSYSQINDKAIIWQEMPINTGDHQHIDSIIIDKKDDSVDIYYIEAKRLYNNKFVDDVTQSSLEKDYSRFDFISNRGFINLFPGLYLVVRGFKKIRQHIVFMASTELFEGYDIEKIKNITDALKTFYEKNEMSLYHYDVKNRMLDNECSINSIDSNNFLCHEFGGKYLINYHLYLMVKTIGQ